jgi:hypothetical protein
MKHMANEEAESLYERLKSMYEIMQQTGGTEDVESAIFEYEDCVSEEDYANWLKKYSFFA